MMVRFGALVLFLFCSGVMAAQNVFTATPKDNSFKFVFSGPEGVYTTDDGQPPLRCSFNKTHEGVDNAGEPYSAIIFTCSNDIAISIKYMKKNKKSFFIVTSQNMQGSASTEVLVKEESY